jgi:hypothetical protein
MPEPQQQLSKASILRRADRTAWQTFDSRVVVLDIPSRTMLGLNETAAHVWQQLDGERDLDSIAQMLADNNGLLPARVCRDVIAFAEALLERGCIELACLRECD